MGEAAHISGMSLSYVVMLIAFYVDNGKQLPIWKDLPHFTYWLVPLVVAVPLIVWALLRHPMVLLMKRATHVEFKSKARAHRAARMRAHGSCARCCLSFEWIGARGKGLSP
jgi:hypothetical protein